LARLAEALRLSGTKRLGAILEALPAGERGAYLPRVEADWARRRAAEIDERCLEARIEAAEIAFVAGDYPLARRLGEEAVAADPFRESGWQLLIRIATEVGDTAAATLALRRCETALAEVGGAPTGATRALAGI
jgi:DNA-binding SARP family transcriptional activator